MLLCGGMQGAGWDAVGCRVLCTNYAHAAVLTHALHLQVQLTSLQGSLADAERRVYESELIRRKLHNTIQVRTGSCRAPTILPLHMPFVGSKQEE
jgi:hypothetical protein